MSLLRDFLRLIRKADGTRPKTSGERITEFMGGANLVDGKQTWEHAAESKHDLETMLKCCEAELETMRRVEIPPAPYYFERVAILLRKAKQYDREIEICERYIKATEHYYSSIAPSYAADVRKGPRFQAIRTRIAKARELKRRGKDGAM